METLARMEHNHLTHAISSHQILSKTIIGSSKQNFFDEMK